MTAANRHTQSIALTAAEADLVKQAAAARGLSASGWAHGRISAVLASKAAQVAAAQDMASYVRRGISSSDRVARVSTILPTADYMALKAVAEREGTTAHAISQAVVVIDAERELGGAVPRRAREMAERAAPPAPAAALPADVIDMLAALDKACWPDRAKPFGSAAASYADALAARAKVREGMVRLANHGGRDRGDVELVASAVIDHPTCRDVAAMLCLSIEAVARAVALRCLLNREKLKPAPSSPAPADGELAQLVADALTPIGA